MTFSRNNQINKLKNNDEYDLLIIGGGIVGAATLTIASNAGQTPYLLIKTTLHQERQVEVPSYYMVA